ncbi:hypothetical protein ACFL54_04715 [Planctomycetota bacterium]
MRHSTDQMVSKNPTSLAVLICILGAAAIIATVLSAVQYVRNYDKIIQNATNLVTVTTLATPQIISGYDTAVATTGNQDDSKAINTCPASAIRLQPANANTKKPNNIIELPRMASPIEFTGPDFQVK